MDVYKVCKSEICNVNQKRRSMIINIIINIIYIIFVLVGFIHMVWILVRNSFAWKAKTCITLSI